MQPHIPGRPRSTRWGPQIMNRGSDGCSTESACGVGLANSQDARIMCKCAEDVKYICGSEVILSGTEVRDDGRQRAPLPHSTNKKNRNRIRRSILRMIYAASLKKSKETDEQRMQIDNLKEQLKYFAARPRQGKQVIVKKREKPIRPQVTAPRREREKGRKCIRYPKSWYPNTPVCTKSKGGKRKYNVGTGRGQRRSRCLKRLLSTERERTRDLARWIFRDLPTKLIDIQEVISEPNFMQSRGQIFNLAQSSTFSPSSTGTGLQSIFLDPGYYVQVPSI